MRERQQIWEPVKFLTNLNLVYVSYTQGGKKYFKDLKGLKGVSLCQDSNSLNVRHHICMSGSVIWVSTWQLWKREARKGPERKEPVFPTIKPQGRRKAVPRMQRREKPGDVRGKRHCRHSVAMVVPLPATWSLQSMWLQPPSLSKLWVIRENAKLYRALAGELHQSLTSGEPGKNSASKTSPPTPSFQVL